VINSHLLYQLSYCGSPFSDETGRVALSPPIAKPKIHPFA